MNYLIYGASRGLGAYLSRHLPQSGDSLWMVSRSQPNSSHADGVQRRWIKADLADPQAARHIAEQLGEVTLDVVIYNAGIWEDSAFSDAYDFESIPEAETLQIMMVNLTSAILCVQKVVPHLRRSQRPRLFLIGSISGLENVGSSEVAYNASKFGMRGAAHALRESLRQYQIPVTCLNLGTISRSDDTDHDIPPSDICAMIKAVIALSNHSIIKEVDFFALSDTWG